MKFIITAGGQGTKLWPLSKEKAPKQFSNIIGGKSLFQRNLDDLLTVYTPDDIYVSTSEVYAPYVEEQAPIIPKSHFIFEPHIRRDTGPASCYAMIHMLRDFPDEVVGFYVQPVVIREPREEYIRMLKEMEILVKRHGQLMTGGMKPTHPEVGSDYISLGSQLSDTGTLKVYVKNKYVERPSTFEEAQQIFDTMDLVIHCNHYAWTPQRFFDSLKKHRPDWYEVSMEIYDLVEAKKPYDKIRDAFAKYEPGKVEHFTKKVYENEGVQVVILPFRWTHITTWNDVYEYLKRSGNPTHQGKTVHIDSSDNIVINKTDSIISLLGVNGFVVIKTDDVTLICPKEKSGLIQDLLREIENQDYSHVL